MIDTFLLGLPLWLDGVVIVFLCLLSAELGRFVARRIASKKPRASIAARPETEGYIIGAIFGLLAFMVSLTFSIAVDRFEGRRGAIADEANAINTAFLRADLLDEPHRTRLQATLQAYGRTRIAPDGLWDQQMQQQLARSRLLAHLLWNETRAAIYPIRDTDLAAYFVEAINRTLEVGALRELAGTTHLPSRILNALLLYLFVSAGMLGYLLGDQRRRQQLVSGLLYALFAIAIVLIIDLDRPRAGSIKVSQEPLEDLIASFDRTRPQTVPAVRP